MVGAGPVPGVIVEESTESTGKFAVVGSIEEDSIEMLGVGLASGVAGMVDSTGSGAGAVFLLRLAGISMSKVGKTV